MYEYNKTKKQIFKALKFQTLKNAKFCSSEIKWFTSIITFFYTFCNVILYNPEGYAAEMDYLVSLFTN